MQSLILGGYGLVLKQDAQEQLVNAIRAVHRGAYWHGDRSYNTANELVHALKPSIPTEETPKDVLATISPRDKKILEMLSAGRPNKEIAYELQTSEQVIKNSVRKLFGKFQVDNRVELALYAVNHALVGDSNLAWNDRAPNAAGNTLDLISNPNFSRQLFPHVVSDHDRRRRLFGRVSQSRLGGA